MEYMDEIGNLCGGGTAAVSESKIMIGKALYASFGKALITFLKENIKKEKSSYLQNVNNCLYVFTNNLTNNPTNNLIAV